MRITVKGGTVADGASLCATCSYGLVRRGYGTAEEDVICHVATPAGRVPFKVRECTEYEDRRIPSLYSMEKVAWILLTKSAGRSVGFVTGDRFREIEGEDAQVVPRTAYGIKRK